MSWTFKQSTVGSASGNTGKTVSATFTSPVAIGDLLIVHVQTMQSGSTQSVTAVTDSAGNSYTNSGTITTEYGTSGDYMSVGNWTAIAETAATPTVSATVSVAAYINLAVAEFSFTGFKPTGDGYGIVSTTGTSLSPGPIGVSGTDLVLSIASQINTSNPTWTNTSGYTTLVNVPWSATTIALQIEYLENATVSTTPSLTSSQAVAGAVFGTSSKLVKPTYTLTGPNSGISGSISGHFTVTPGALVGWDTISLSDGGAGGTFSPTSLSFTNNANPLTFTYTNPTTTPPTLTLTSSDGGTITGSPWVYNSLVTTPGSFRSTSDLIVSTSNTSLFVNNTSASASFFIKFNSITPQAVSSSSNLFYGGMLLGNGLGISAPDTSNLSRCTINYSGPVEGINTPFTPVVGITYHVAISWSPTNQVIYINGLVAATSSFQNALAGTPTQAPFYLGWMPYDGSVDYEIGQLAIWNNYALTQTDVTSLLYQNVTPNGVSTPATSWWPFGGSSGNMVEPGDAGLADVTSGVNFNSVKTSNSGGAGSPTTNSNNALVYAGALQYIAPITTVPYVSKCGSLVFFQFVTISTPQNPQYITSVIANPTVYVNGVQVSITGPYWTMKSNEHPFIIYQLPSTILSTDVVTFTAPLGWASSSLGEAGQSPAPGVGGTLPVANYTGQYEAPVGTALPFGMPATQRTMPVGFNMSGPPAGGSAWFANKNWMKTTLMPWANVATSDSLGHPLTVGGTGSSAGNATTTVVASGAHTYIDLTTMPDVTGTWTLIANESAPNTPMTVTMYSGGSNELIITGGLISQGVVNSSGVAVGKMWQFTTAYPASPQNYEQDLTLSVKTYNAVSPGPWTLSEEYLYSPVNNGPLPQYTQTNPMAMDQTTFNSLTMPSGLTASCLRWMDSTETYGGDSNIVDASDLLNPNLFTWNLNVSSPVYDGPQFTVETIRPYSLTPITGVTPGSPYIYSNQFGSPAPSGSPGLYQIAPANLNFMNLGEGTDNQWYFGEMVTTAPHGIKTGQLVELNSSPTITITNGPSATVTTGAGGGMAIVTGPNTFAVANWAGSITGGVNATAPLMPYDINEVANSQASVALSITGHVEQPFGSTIPYDAAVAATASLPKTNIWINIPYAATDACAAAIAQIVLNGLPSDRLVYVEYGNEVWNFKNATRYLNMLQSLGYLDPGYFYHYAHRASQVHEAFANAFIAAKRGNQVVRVMGSQWGPGSPGEVTPFLAEAAYRAANFPNDPPIQIDAVATAPYVGMPDDAWPDPITAATVNVTGGGTTGGLLAAGTYYVSYTWVDAVTGLETSPGASQSPLPSPTAMPTGVASGTTGSLTPGNYYFSYTYTASSGGETSGHENPSPIKVSATNVVTITFNDTMPSWATGRNLYLTAPGGGIGQPVYALAGTETLYASGITASTYAMSSNSWTNGTTTQAAATAIPTVNTTSLGTAFTVASGNIPQVTIALPTTPYPQFQKSSNIYLSKPGTTPGAMVLYMTGITTTTANLSTANVGTVTPPPHSRIPSFKLATASIYSTYRNSIAYGSPATPWTRAMFFDLFRHSIHYSNQYVNPLSGPFQGLQAYVPVNNQPKGFIPQMFAYEASVQGVCSEDVGSDSGQIINLGAILTHDIFYDPNFYDIETEFYRMCQAAGYSLINLFNYVDNNGGANSPGTTIWGTSVFSGQPWGKGDGSNGGITNLFAQNTGKSQHYRNASVKMQAWRDWANTANVPAKITPTPSLKRRRLRLPPRRLRSRV